MSEASLLAPQGSTPTIELVFGEDIDLSTFENVYVAFKQGFNVLRKEGDDLERNGNKLSIYMRQKDTLRFDDGEVEVQFNGTFSDGNRAVSNKALITITDNIIREVLE